MSQLEKPIENEILHFLKMIGVYCWKNQSVGIWSQARKAYIKPKNPHHIRGVSDILGVIEGRLLAIEVKSEKGRLTPEQREFLAKVNNEGGIAFLARSKEAVALELYKHFPSNKRLMTFAKEFKIDLDKH